jgi:hypothetical protein
MPAKTVQFLLALFLCYIKPVAAQDDDGMIRTTDGHAIATKSSFITACKKTYSAAGDSLVAKACECQANLLNNYFTTHQLGFFQKRYKEKTLQVLIERDPVIQKKLQECSAPVEHLQLVSVSSSRKQTIKKCVENLKKQNTKPLNDTLVIRYCNCAVEIMQNRKITTGRIEELADPSSFLYNEIAYQCGSPFSKLSDFSLDWKVGDSANIVGLSTIDSMKIISVLGMHKVKITIGGITRIWLLDSGASDLLISEEYAKQLKEKGVLTDSNYIGEGQYSLADNSVLSCKRYKINEVKIGRFEVNNVVIAISAQAKEFLLGKSLLNKFSLWTLDNKNDVLILRK